ncbi:hypothetical protein EQV77_15490 [Halobacillus fulvus]|nr:hypothetical protein EQV77_15490 [Halobacillus fulvus]
MISILYVTALLIGITIACLRAKKYKEQHGSYGSWRQYMTSGCFFTMSLVLFIAIQADWLGIASTALALVLLIAAAYFTRYLPAKTEA